MPDTIPTRISPFPNQRPTGRRLPLIDDVVAKPASIRLARQSVRCITCLIETRDEVLTFCFDANGPILMSHDGYEQPAVGQCRPAAHPEQPRAMAQYHAEDVYVHIESLDRSNYWIGVVKDGRDTHLRIATTDGRKRIRLENTSQGNRNLPVRDLTCAGARSAFPHEPQ